MALLALVISLLLGGSIGHPGVHHPGAVMHPADTAGEMTGG